VSAIHRFRATAPAVYAVKRLTIRAATPLLLLLWLACNVHADTGAFSAVSAESAGMSAERLQRLDDALRRYVDDQQLAGSVTLVARRGGIVYLHAAGFRDREAGAAMQQDTMFRIASQTKAVVSVAAMMLIEEGSLLLNERIDRWLPEFAQTTVAEPREGGGYDVVPARRAITVRDLLTHTSGFDYGAGPAADRWRDAGIQGWYFADRDEPIGATVARMAALPAAAHPGERWVYGYSTDILGALIERVSGQSLDQFLAARLFAPLAMNDTHFFVPQAKRERVAVVYGLQDRRLTRAPQDGSAAQGAYVDGPRQSFSGGAGLVSTAGDYARFLQMLLNGGELDGTRILSPKTVELMTMNHIGELPFNAGQRMGLGFSVVTDVGARGQYGSAGEYGWGGAYHSTYWVDPSEDLLVVHLTQLIPAAGVDDFERVRTLVYSALID
jgi:CubicO group peptidase (beta-lactamase class C family)